jgi:hypothetical protein
VLHRCARNKQCYTAVLLPKHYTTRKQMLSESLPTSLHVVLFFPLFTMPMPRAMSSTRSMEDMAPFRMEVQRLMNL